MTSWKTTIGGSLQAAGTAMMGISLVPGSTSMNAAEDLKWVLIVGTILSAVGGQLLGLAARDNNVTSEQVKAQNQTK